MMDFGQAWIYLTHQKGAKLRNGNTICTSHDGMHVEVETPDDSDEIVKLNYSEFGQRFGVNSRFVEVSG